MLCASHQAPVEEDLRKVRSPVAYCNLGTKKKIPTGTGHGKRGKPDPVLDLPPTAQDLLLEEEEKEKKGEKDSWEL